MVPAPAKKRNKENIDRQSATAATTPQAAWNGAYHMIVPRVLPFDRAEVLKTDDVVKLKTHQTHKPDDAD